MSKFKNQAIIGLVNFHAEQGKKNFELACEYRNKGDKKYFSYAMKDSSYHYAKAMKHRIDLIR